MFKYLIAVAIPILLYGSTLNLATSSNPSRINPILATDSASSEVANFIFNALVKYDKSGKSIVGELALSYYFEDNRTIVFELRKDVVWHDGERFDVDDVIFTYNLLRSDSVVSPYSAPFTKIKSIIKLDQYRLKVIYEKPYFKALETWMMGILPEHILKDESDIMSSKFNTAPVGTGAYRLKKLEFSKRVILEANEDYFESAPKINTISLNIIPDSMTRFLLLKSGSIDIGNLDAMQLDRQLDDKFFKEKKIVEQISRSYTYLGFNLRDKRFQDPRVREALSLALDRRELVDILFMGHGRVCTGPFLPGSRAFNPDVKAPLHDIKRAKELLLSAGYSDKNPLRFEIATSNSNSIRPYAAQIIQHQFAKVGVEVTLRILEWQAFLNLVVFARKFDSVLLGWSLSLSPDPYPLWHSDSDKDGAFNFIGYRDDEVDRLIEAMQLSVESDRVSQFQREIFAKIVEDNPYLFLYIPNSITAIDRDISGIEPSITGIWHNYTDWKILP